MLAKPTQSDITGPTMPAGLQSIPLDQLHESIWNPRRHFNEKALAELVESVRQYGILTPLLVRTNGSGYEVAAGHRRLRAAHGAGLTEVPAIVRPMSDQQFCEVVTIENLQREDVHPIEEADGYQRLIELYGYTPATLAERVGRSESYIAKRLALSKLIKPAKDAFLADRIQLGHAILLARLKAENQKQAVKEALFKRADRWDRETGRYVNAPPQACRVSELDNWIRSNIYLDLSAAAWRKDDATLLSGAGPCTTCPKRTGANGLLFDDLQKGDMCLDAECFQQKRDNHLINVQKTAVEKGTVLLRISLGYVPDREALNVMDWNAYEVVEKKADRCEHLEKALVVAGDRDIGQVVDVCRAKSCKKHGRFLISPGASKGTTFEEEWKQKRANLDQRIELERRKALFRALSEDTERELQFLDWTLIVDRLIDRAGHDGCRAICDALKLQSAKAQHHNGRDVRKAVADHAEAMLPAQLPAFAALLCHYKGLVGWDEGEKELRQAVEAHDLDAAAIEAQASAALKADFEKKYSKAKAAHLEAQSAAKKAAKRDKNVASVKTAGKKPATAKKPGRKSAAAGAEASDAAE